jgi:methionyl-tRNA formyltransferase
MTRSTVRDTGAATAERDDRLRIVLVTEDDPLYVIHFFDRFFDAYPEDEMEIVGVTVSDAFHEPIWKTASRILKFYGPVDFARLLPRYLAAKASGRSITALAETAKLPLLPCQSVNEESYVRSVRELEPDVIVSVAAPEIFRAPLLQSSRLGCINIHSGRLPKYRGMMPTFWQMLNGEPHITITVHEMAEQLDAGGVLATDTFDIQTFDHLDRVIIGTKRLGADLMISTLRSLASGTATATSLDMTQAEYFSFPTPDAVTAFRRRGHQML